MIDSTRRGLLLAGAAASLAPMRPAAAQASAPQPAGYPSKPLRFIIASPPGGLLDNYARLFCDQFSDRFKVPAVPENRPGASGIIATEAMVKAPPDGYTLLIGSTGMYWQTRVLYRKLPFDLERDIAPITMYPTGPLILAATERTGIKDFQGMLAYARKQRCTMGNYVTGSYQQVLAESLNRDQGCKFEMVHYKGEVPMWVDMGADQLDVAIGSFQAFNNIKDKGLKPLAATGRIRSPRMPDLPTMIEQGFTGPVSKLESGIPVVAHSAVPTEILDFLGSVAVEFSNTPRARALRENFAIPQVTGGRPEILRMWKEDAPVWIREVQALNLKIE